MTTAGVTVIETEVAEHAKAMLRLNHTDVARVCTVKQDGPGTAMFMVVAHYGWAESILASDAYAADAQGLALAVAALFGCEYDVTATDEIATRTRT